MSHIQHIPGIRSTFPVDRSSSVQCIGVLGLHEGRTLMKAARQAAHTGKPVVVEPLCEQAGLRAE